MPRLDAERIGLLRSLTVTVTAIRRQIEADLMAEYELPLSWFEVMSALQRQGGTMRVHDVCNSLDEVASSLSRRLDRMEEEGYVSREPAPTPADRRAVDLSLTRDGRLLWRDANVIYRRGVQRHFAHVVTDSDVHALQRVLSKLTR
ncbi:MAG: MarR family transcriptional regulator [Actinomycetota bacterium]|jgi:DNA-binding MarR family transcriptional regulator|nr:MAG: putative MarR family transcriptional regulator [Acidimicrobiaceae bacterium]